MKSYYIYHKDSLNGSDMNKIKEITETVTYEDIPKAISKEFSNFVSMKENPLAAELYFDSEEDYIVYNNMFTSEEYIEPVIEPEDIDEEIVSEQDETILALSDMLMEQAEEIAQIREMLEQ